MADLSIRCSVQTPDGLLDINDRNVYRLEASSIGSSQVTYRRQQATSPYVPGTYTVNAVPETITEVVGVYVYGNDHYDLRKLLERLTAAFTQMVYTVFWEVENDSYAWRCEIADYTVDTRREFRHSTMALATFQVPRYPALFTLEA